MHDIIIVGGGPAGLTAAVYALRAGKSVLVIEKGGFGGQIAFSPKVENIPGTISISGAAFADQLVEQAMNLGADMELETVVRVEKTGDGFLAHSEEGSTFPGKAVILATGVKHRTLGLPGEQELIGNGISFCAVCDGAFYTGQDVAMVGGGNSAMQEALLLSEVCRKVTIVQNLANFTGEQKLAQALSEKENVEVFFNTVVTGYEQTDGTLTGLELHNTQSGADSHIRVDGAFLAVGLIPENEVTRGAGVTIDRMTSGAAVNQYRETDVDGIYSCGNVLHVHDLVDFVSEEADIAGRAAAAKIMGQTAPVAKSIEVKTGFGVRYTVPERIDLSADPEVPVRIFFRVSNVYKKVQLRIETESGTIIAKRAKSAVAPGEMESMEIPVEALCELVKSDDKYVTVYLEEK